MGVDYAIGYGCVPKEAFTTQGVIERVKGGERADTIQEFYQDHGEERPPAEMGFEMIYRNAQGEEETRLIQLDDLLAQRAELTPYEEYCTRCAANRTAEPFGCIGSINYPISAQAEVWMLSRLPHPDEPLPFLLLKEGPQMGNTGERAVGLRDANPGVFFESVDPIYREYPEMNVTGEQLFELLFLLGTIPPKRAVMILLFLGAIPRHMDASELVTMTPAPADAAERYPFLLQADPADDATQRNIKAFLHALYLAWLLDRDVLVDV